MIRVPIPIVAAVVIAAPVEAMHVDEAVGGATVASIGIIANYVGNALNVQDPVYYAVADSLARFGASVGSAAALQDVLGLSEEYLDYNAEMAAGDVLMTLVTYGSVPAEAPEQSAYVLALTMAVSTLPRTPIVEAALESLSVPVRPLTHWMGLLALSGITLGVVESIDEALGDETAVPVDTVLFRFDPSWLALEAAGEPGPVLLGTLYDALGASLGAMVVFKPATVPKILLEPGEVIRRAVGSLGRVVLSALERTLP